MKNIRTVKYIDMFVKTNDHELDHLIDLTVEPYYQSVHDTFENIQNICKIIYKKSLNYGFTTSKALEFSKIAGSDHLIKMGIVESEEQSKILNIIINNLIDNKREKLEIKSNDSDFIIIKNNETNVIIHDYGETSLNLLKYLVDIDSKMIKLDFNLKTKLVNISFLDQQNEIKNITEFEISDENFHYIKNNLDQRYILDIIENNDGISVYFLKKIILETKDNEIKFVNISGKIENKEDNFIRSYENIIEESKTESETETETESETENNLESNVIQDESEFIVFCNQKKSKKIFSYKRDNLLINPIVFVNFLKERDTANKIKK